MNSLHLVQNWFEREAGRFDSIYEKDKPLYQKIGDALFHRVIHERFSLVINALGAQGATILDVGCGPGRYGVELARRGAARCLGVDMAAHMIEIARTEADRAGVGDRCEWTVLDFLSFKTTDTFSAVLAMGYYDYIDNPRPHLEKMMALSSRHVFASFPKRWEIRTPLRRARFALQGGFVRFYSRAEVISLFASTGNLRYLSLVDLGRDFVAIYDAGSATNGA